MTKRYGGVVAVDAVSLDVPPGAFVSLLGPSGCGKTTLLRLVGGFEAPDAGRVLIGGDDVTGRPPQARPTAMVFQSYALFPTMTVEENVAYGLRVRRVPRAARAEQVRQALRRVDLSGLEDRPVTALSGGQQQRVALARALAVAPAVLLFDEPLSNLDQALREQTRAELKWLQGELGTTSLYVTHDQQEALALSDRIAVMRAGRIVEVGPPEALYAEPETAYVAQFLGGANVVSGALAEQLAGAPPPDGSALAVRPEALAPSDAGGGALPARFVARQFLGTHAEWAVEVEDPEGAGDVRLRLWTPPETAVPDRLFVRATRTRWVRREGAA
ncbi:MAG: ABC transporter ATP-binding protein [Rubricoccaceae bacterium]|nr:ABC transporter ATP-binding protein [Rubricoccaceae bacterium]